ncbi:MULTISPECIES: putative quinol monooxygenase [unclassified Sphingomonas]|uniref:putative quinol monooxygenase n=1 Tax=unclassified Sphingomonas TaxID=196159 RepID=UPI0022B484B7|nr:antibiotic biosynthesis monooxygenase family protein [Sphingomonas sp. NIBR02145]WHU03776.1 antibiotic biosynthesis monooxygenase family protein [Sphingomonas sp. NIBR02145]
MTIARRPVLAGFALAMLGAPALAREFRMEEELYGMVGKIKAQPGKRAELVALLSGGTADMPGCIAYLIAEDLGDADGIWITEVWKTKQFHADSLKLPAVRDAIAKGRPLIAGFETHVETRPVTGAGIRG